ncbi:DUF456 domain-containing protein [Ornithinicoccus hortensis]|uniref:DUF456 domain-containing protein n=1 Tax=Ornithinicoccus hortensis TaxID=82346 RepID=A0A542YU34_9MICO|nr:DUF456 domain-containing protein [Ornithinicoccus hortensis]TQL51597.1 hypothetical protein FB467_2747 [Ornithinicoccus hortensis]
MTVITVIAGLVMLVGLIGIVIPVLPGLLLVWAGILLWTLETQGGAWWVFGIATAIAAACLLLEYTIPGKRMRKAGVRTSTLLAGLGVAIVGFFVIPGVGALLGFPLGIYLVERARRGGHAQAWTATKHALKAVGLNILIELASALVMVGVWLASIIWIL